MKKMRLIIAVIFIANIASAQTYAEWFRQKKTQINYLEQQIASLRTYALAAEKGYDIVKSGLNTINNIKEGDFSLHGNYFLSLQKANPNIKAYTKIAEIIALQADIVKACHQQQLNLNKSEQFSSNETACVKKIFDNLLDGCTEIIEQLITLTSDGVLLMKDDERINNIDRLYNEMQQRYQFVRQYGNENAILTIQRIKDKHDVNVSKELHGLHWRAGIR
jgi:hypothetical protein